AMPAEIARKGSVFYATRFYGLFQHSDLIIGLRRYHAAMPAEIARKGSVFYATRFYGLFQHSDLIIGLRR
ncbi:hypothetical protein QWT33_23815, partial [Salmonella enterica subsp. enterica serovar Typhi]|nr:hypothetical protein [Salmonella enterica subsp. enterica serovar Typhi]